MLDAVHLVLFADDVVVLPRLDIDRLLPREEWLSLYQQALDGLTQWASDNQMEFNADKSNIVWFTRPRMHSHARALEPAFRLSGFVLQTADSYTYLGVLLHRSLGWQMQFDRMLDRASTDSFLISRLIQSDGPPHFPAIRALCMGYLRARCTYALALWRPSADQLRRLQSLFLRPLRRLLHLPVSTNACGLLVEADCPSFARYRQSLLHQMLVRITRLPMAHPTRQLWQWEGHVSGDDQIRPRQPALRRSLGVEVFHSMYRTTGWGRMELMGPDCAIRSKQYAMQLTHADWLAVLHRDPSGITPLRSLKPRPGRSMYLYREETRDTATLRARLRFNRANIALNMDRAE